MASTLEQVHILSRDFDLAEHEYQRALDVMRRYGYVGKRLNNLKKCYSQTPVRVTFVSLRC